MADSLSIAFISSVDNEGYPCTKASIYFCDAKGFKGMMLRGTMEVLTDAESKEMIWRKGDTQYYPGGVTDPSMTLRRYCNWLHFVCSCQLKNFVNALTQ